MSILAVPCSFLRISDASHSLFFPSWDPLRMVFFFLLWHRKHTSNEGGDALPFFTEATGSTSILSHYFRKSFINYVWMCQVDVLRDYQGNVLSEIKQMLIRSIATLITGLHKQSGDKSRYKNVMKFCFALRMLHAFIKQIARNLWLSGSSAFHEDDFVYDMNLHLCDFNVNLWVDIKKISEKCFKIWWMRINFLFSSMLYQRLRWSKKRI